MSRVVFLTGVTGFIGKLVLRRLLEDDRVSRVYALVRPADQPARAKTRIERLFRSLPLQGLPEDCKDRVHAVPGDLRAPGLAIPDDLRRALERDITHVVHLAASVRFDLPGDQAASINVDGALQIQQLAEAAGAERLISVSTAYVHPPGPGPHRAERVQLPGPAHELLAMARVNVEAACARTGHLNSYTLTKSLAEHLLYARQDRTRLTLVRPSIVSVALRWPVPGWVDSAAAHAGMIAAIGAGLYRVLEGSPSTRLDLIPVDIVAERVVDAIDSERDVIQVVAGPNNSPSIEEQKKWTIRRLRNRPVRSTPRLVTVPAGAARQLVRAAFQQAPLYIEEGIARMQGEGARARRAARARDRVRRLDATFRGFMNASWSFEGSALPADFDRQDYLDTVAMGVHEHLLKGDSRAVPVAGKRSPGTDVRWALRPGAATPLQRAFGLTLRSTARRCVDRATVDVDSLEVALEAVPPGHNVLLCPNHRSFVDFLFVSYALHALPEVHLDLPSIAAASAFARIPILGTLFANLGAFYLNRGQGAADAKLNQLVADRVSRNPVIQVFVEGERSRSGAFMRPRRGVLRTLQSTRQPFMVIPLSLAYDRVPDVAPLLRELHGFGKTPMTLQGLGLWLKRAYGGEIDLGRMHLAAGMPILLDLDADVGEVATLVQDRQRERMATTTYHLDAFADRSGVSPSALRRSLEARGAHVLESGTRVTVTDAEERWMRPHWQHHAAPELQSLAGTHPGISDHLRRTAGRTVPTGLPPDEVMMEAAKVLARSVVSDWEQAKELVARGPTTRMDVVRDALGAWPDEVHAALDFMIADGQLIEQDGELLAVAISEQAAARARYRQDAAK